MVTKTPAKSKSTYAERVLGAFSQIQREHRRHAVHQASIRAQVKKNASRKDDKLGPHWTSWVNKAVVKLESEGILEPASPGSVALTPNGKKAIANARRSVRNSFGSPVDAHDDLIWKEIATHKSKRSHRESSSGYDSDQTSILGTPQKKKSKSSAAPSSTKKPTSRMTRSELQEEVQVLKRTHAQQERRDTSPLTDLDDEDEDLVSQLREDLRKRDQEVESLRQELEISRRTASPTRMSGQRDMSNFDQTPHSSFSTQAISVPARRIPQGVTRTQSGSFISNLSKRPTPAPSSPERDLRDGDGDTDIDMEEPHSGFVDPVSPTPLRPRPDAAIRFRTPDSVGDVTSPPSQSDHEQRGQDFTPRELQSELVELRLRLSADTDALELRAAEIARLEATLLDHSKESESLVAARDATISRLEDDNSLLRAEVAENTVSLRRAEDALSSKTSQLQDLEARLLVVTADLDRSRSELEERYTLQNGLRRELDTAMETLRDKDHANGITSGHLAAAYDEIATLKQRESDKQSRIEDLLESLTTSSNDVTILQKATTNLEQTILSLRTEAQLQQEDCDALRLMVQGKDLELSQLQSDLQTKEQSLQDMASILSGKQSEVDSLSADLEKTRHSVVVTEAQIDDLTNRLRLEGEERTGLMSEVSGLQTALHSMEADNGRLNTQLSDAQKLTDEFRRIVTDNDKELQVLKARLVGEVRMKETMEADLARYVGEIHDLQDDIRVFEHTKNEDEKKLSELRASLQSIRQSHLSVLGDLDRTIESVYPAHMSQESGR